LVTSYLYYISVLIRITVSSVAKGHCKVYTSKVADILKWSLPFANLSSQRVEALHVDNNFVSR